MYTERRVDANGTDVLFHEVRLAGLAMNVVRRAYAHCFSVRTLETEQIQGYAH